MNTFEERFWSRVDKNGPIPAHMPHLGRCWEWTASQRSTGYGQFYAPKSMGAHRFIWKHKYGELDDGICVLHHCDNPKCVRPSHLFVGTMADNMNDMAAKRRNLNQQKTHCPRGHEYTKENILKKGTNGKGRGCRTCDRKRALNHYHKTKQLKHV